MGDRIADRQSGRTIRARLVLASVLMLAVLLGAGCGDEASRKAALTEQEIERLTFAPKPTRSDVLMVSGEEIACEDVMGGAAEAVAGGASFRERLEELAAATTLEQFIQVARPQLKQRLDVRISNVVLYKRAKQELGEQVDERLEAMAETELRRFVVEHGGNNAEADEALRGMGMNRPSFKEYAKRQMLAQYARSSRLPSNRPITYSELVDTYESMKDVVFVRPGLIQFRLIDIQAGKVEVTDPNDDLVSAARAVAEGLVTRIIAGEDFGKLAKEYSHGFRRAYGGLWTPRDPESLAEPYAILGEKSKLLEEGEIGGPIDVPGHAFIMKLEKKREKSYLPLAAVQEKVEERIRIDRRRAALERLYADVAAQAAVADTSPFLDGCLTRLHGAVNAAAAAP
jgi:hypothetical protein